MARNYLQKEKLHKRLTVKSVGHVVRVNSPTVLLLGFV